MEKEVTWDFGIISYFYGVWISYFEPRSSGVNHAPPWTDMLDEWRRRMDGWTYNPLVIAESGRLAERSC